MALQYSGSLRTNQAAQIVATIGTGGLLKIFSGPEPANTAAADPSGLLCQISLPSSFLTAGSPSAGQTALNGTWSGTGTSTAGSGTTAASFRMYDTNGVCHLQGNCSTDLVLNNSSIAFQQAVSITGFTITVGNQ
jgi:hypothetical protein